MAKKRTKRRRGKPRWAAGRTRRHSGSGSGSTLFKWTTAATSPRTTGRSPRWHASMRCHFHYHWRPSHILLLFMHYDFATASFRQPLDDHKGNRGRTAVHADSLPAAAVLKPNMQEPIPPLQLVPHSRNISVPSSLRCLTSSETASAFNYRFRNRPNPHKVVCLDRGKCPVVRTPSWNHPADIIVRAGDHSAEVGTCHCCYQLGEFVRA